MPIDGNYPYKNIAVRILLANNPFVINRKGDLCNSPLLYDLNDGRHISKLMCLTLRNKVYHVSRQKQRTFNNKLNLTAI